MASLLPLLHIRPLPVPGLSVSRRWQKVRCQGLECTGVVTNVFTPELELEETQLTLFGRQLTVIQPRDVDEVLEMYIKQDRLDRDPYWCRIWPSAIALADEILAHPELVCGLRMCDLGAGLGLAGLAAALAGAREVVLYDREVQALFCALLNMHANIPGISTNLPEVAHMIALGHGSVTPTNIPPLLMSEFQTICSVPQHLALSLENREGQRKMGERLRDSQSSVKAEMFDWTKKAQTSVHAELVQVLACDVLYEKPAIPLIADLVPSLLRKRAGARLLVSDPIERNPHNRELLIQQFESQIHATSNIQLEVREERRPTMDGSQHQVEILRFIRQDKVL